MDLLKEISGFCDSFLAINSSGYSVKRRQRPSLHTYYKHNVSLVCMLCGVYSLKKLAAIVHRSIVIVKLLGHSAVSIHCDITYCSFYRCV